MVTFGKENLLKLKKKSFKRSICFGKVPKVHDLKNIMQNGKPTMKM